MWRPFQVLWGEKNRYYDEQFMLERLCPSAGRSVGRSVRQSVRPTLVSRISEKSAKFEQNSIGNMKDNSETNTRADRQYDFDVCALSDLFNHKSIYYGFMKQSCSIFGYSFYLFHWLMNWLTLVDERKRSQ